MKTLIASIGILCISAQLVWAEQQTDQAEKITFEEHVKPILRQHCANCHNQGEKMGGLAVDSYVALIEGGGSGEVVFDDGDAEGSRLWQLINHDDTPVMPPNQDKLPAEQLAMIRKWIEAGILENSGSKAKAKKKNALAFVASAGGKPEGGGAMPETIPQRTPVVTERAAAITAIAASPWAPLVAVAGQKQIVLYHADTQELLGILPFEEGIAQSIRFSRDGSFLIVGGGTHSSKGIAAVYNVTDGQRVAVVGDELDTVFGADANDTMTRIALGGPQKMLRIYDATDGEQLFDLKKHTDWIYTVAYSPDGVLVASGDRAGGLCVWEAETGRLYLDLTDHKGAIRAVAWRDDSNVLASASEDGTVKMWDMNQGKAIKSFNAHGGGVTDVAFDHQGRLVTVGNDKLAKLWDPSGNHVKDLPPTSEQALEVAITHDAKRVIYGDWAGAVMNVSVDDAADKHALAANPPPVAARIEQVERTLVSVQTELQPLKQSLDAAIQNVAVAKNPLTALDQAMAAKQAEAEAAEANAEAARNKIKSIDEQLPQLTSTSRDAHDAVIAGRLALQSNPQQSEAVAAAEQALADQLGRLAQLRRERMAAEKSVQANVQLLAAKRAEADQLSKTRPPLQQKLDAAQQVAEKAKSAHLQVAARLTSIQDKLNQLVAEVD